MIRHPMSGKQNKEYNEDEVDLVESQNQVREQEIKKDVKDIHERYGYIVTEPHLVEQGYEVVYPFQLFQL